jgi:UDP-glucose 4-epimerase
MNILVTGGAGFIGSHVADAYLALGHRVVIVDDLSSGSTNNLPRDAEFIEMSLLDRDGLSRLFERERFDVVSNHAAQTSVPGSVADPAYDAQVNILGLIHLLDACASTAVKKFVYVSSGGAVYGESDHLPLTEEEPCAPLSPYGITKAAGEDYLRFYHQVHGLDYTSLRYSNVFGPRQLPHSEASVVPTFMLQILSGQAPVIFGDGLNLRDYTYVGDIVRANVAVLTRGSARCYNIGTGTPTSVIALFHAIAAELAYRGDPQFAPDRPGDLRANCISAERARRELAWEPAVDLATGIHLTAEYFRLTRPAPDAPVASNAAGT